MYSGDEYYDDDITSGWHEEDADERKDRQRRELEREADIEFAWQRDVIGPMFGFDQEEPRR